MTDTLNPTGSRHSAGTGIRWLLGVAAVGAAVFGVTVLIEGALRPGYSPWRHAVSQLSLGPGGWVNSVAILAAAAALLGFALGLRRAMPPGTGLTWGPRLLGVAGMCFVLLAVFPDDPGLGYPPGLAAARSLHGLVHGLAGTMAFGCLSAACFVLARRFAAEPCWRGWARYSIVTGVMVAAGYLATAVVTGLDQAGVLPDAPGGLLQRVMIIVGFSWVVLLAVRLLRRPADPGIPRTRGNSDAAACAGRGFI